MKNNRIKKTLIIVVCIIIVAIIALFVIGLKAKKDVPSNGGANVTELNYENTDYIVTLDNGTTAPLSGKEWINSTTTAKLFTSDTFAADYDVRLTATGWTRGPLTVNDRKIYPPATDVQGTRVWGYTKSVGNALYIMALTETVIDQNYNASSSTPIGPFEYTYKVFIADPVSISYLLE